MDFLRRKATVNCADERPSLSISVADSSGKPEQRALARRKPCLGDKGRSESVLSESSRAYEAAITIKASWEEYCNSTAIHGVRYFAEKGRTRLERVFWVVALALSMGGCVFFIQKAYTKWSSTSIIVSFADMATPVWEVPFPAITVCPEIKSRPNIFNFTGTIERYWELSEKNQTLDNILSEKEWQYLNAMWPICGKYSGRFKSGSLTVPREYLSIMMEVAPPIDEVISFCFWTEHINCKSHFTPVMTDEGLCFTFNMLSHQELFTSHESKTYNQNVTSEGWLIEDWNAEQHQKNATKYPFSALSNGDGSGLAISLKAQKLDHYDRCGIGSDSQSFKVRVHNPAELPLVGKEFFRVPANKISLITVKPSMMTTSSELRKTFDPQRRQCYFSGERPLQYFKIYTQKHCELECLANTTLSTCNCSEFYIPGSQDTPICGTAAFSCVERVREGNVDCNCLPGCTSLEFDAQTSETVDYPQSRLRGFKNDNRNWSRSLVRIFFKNSHFFKIRRSELYGDFLDFLANCGGLLGLFSGFSLISLIEILYHLIIRLWYNAQRIPREQERATAQQSAAPAGGAEASDVEKQQPPRSTHSGRGCCGLGPRPRDKVAAVPVGKF